MLNYILKRLLLMIFTLFIITTLVFVFIRMMPDNRPINPGQSEELWDTIMEREGLNEPIPVQYYYWLRNLFLEGSLGYSRSKQIESSDVIAEKLPISMGINVYSFVLSIPVGFLFGIIAALRKNKMSDTVISLWVIFFISVPSFVTASLLRYFAAYKWEWFPLQYAADMDIESYWDLFVSMVLPILALSFGPIAGLTRFTRAELTEVLTSDFMLLARTKGLSQRQATMRHALRNSMVPLVPIVIGNFIGIMFGGLIVERVFGIPGIGGLLLQSIQGRDFPLVMATLMFYTVINLFTILLVDISYSIVDPRIKLGGSR